MNWSLKKPMGSLFIWGYSINIANSKLRFKVQKNYKK